MQPTLLFFGLVTISNAIAMRGLLLGEGFNEDALVTFYKREDAKGFGGSTSGHTSVSSAIATTRHAQAQIDRTRAQAGYEEALVMLNQQKTWANYQASPAMRAYLKKKGGLIDAMEKHLKVTRDHIDASVLALEKAHARVQYVQHGKKPSSHTRPEDVEIPASAKDPDIDRVRMETDQTSFDQSSYYIKLFAAQDQLAEKYQAMKQNRKLKSDPDFMKDVAALEEKVRSLADEHVENFLKPSEESVTQLTKLLGGAKA
jgi:hypothetical protein